MTGLRERPLLPPKTTGSLDERVLRLMSSFPGPVSFAGLRRTLDTHQESLSRALRRLKRSGSIERTVTGYRLAEQRPEGSGRPWEGFRFPRRGEAPLVELRFSFPGDTSRVLISLAGRWFGEFRWVGSYEEGRRTIMIWVSGMGNEFLGLVLEDRQISVYHQLQFGAPLRDQPPAAYELIQQVMKALGTPEIRIPRGVLEMASVLEDARPSDTAG